MGKSLAEQIKELHRKVKCLCKLQENNSSVDLSLYQLLAEKGQSNGYASLNGTGKHLPSESIITLLEDPVLNGNVLTIKLQGENGIIQTKNIDLSGLITTDINLANATYNASTNIITITETDGNFFTIDLSEFSILVSTDAQGITTLTQEGVSKITISKVGQTGNFNDLLNIPAFLTSYWTSDANNNIQNTNSGSVFSRGGGNVESNTAYGKNALLSNTTGNSNNAFGEGALSANLTGIANVAIGDEALKNSTSVSYNTAIGTSSMFNYNPTNPNGQNVAVGAFSLYSNLDGRYNTVLGTSTMKNSTGGLLNIAIGFHAMENTNGFSNISIGVQAGVNLTTGNNNLIISQGTNGGLGLSTGSGNTIIGHRTGLPANLTNHFIASDGTGVEKFRVDNNGNFAIGTTSPNSSSILDIFSTTKTLTIPRMNNAQQGVIVSPLQGSLIYNNQTYNNVGAFQFRDANGWFNVKRTDIVDLFVLTNPIVPSGTVRKFATGGVQGLGPGTIQVNTNTTNSYAVATGNYTNNTNETIVLNVSGTLTFNSAAWTAGQIIEIRGLGFLLSRIYAPTTGTYQLTANFAGQAIIPPGGIYDLNVTQFSESNKTINTTFTKITMST